MLKKLRHPNIYLFMGMSHTHTHTLILDAHTRTLTHSCTHTLTHSLTPTGSMIKSNELYIITEYMERGSLKDLLLRYGNTLNWRLVVRMVRRGREEVEKRET